MMKIINKFNIKSKLNILFYILIISIFILGYKSINISENNKEELKIVHGKSQEVLALQNSIITPLYKLRELTQSLVMAPNKNIRYGIESSLEVLIKN